MKAPLELENSHVLTDFTWYRYCWCYYWSVLRVNEISGVDITLQQPRISTAHNSSLISDVDRIIINITEKTWVESDSIFSIEGIFLDGRLAVQWSKVDDMQKMVRARHILVSRCLICNQSSCGALRWLWCAIDLSGRWLPTLMHRRTAWPLPMYWMYCRRIVPLVIVLKS